MSRKKMNQNKVVDLMEALKESLARYCSVCGDKVRLSDQRCTCGGSPVTLNELNPNLRPTQERTR